MDVIYVTYAGEPGTHFDREYYVQTHLPLVRQAWGPHGLVSLEAYFPAGGGEGTIAIAECKFRDTAAADASFGAPETKDVMADVKNFTDVKPALSRAQPL